MRRAIHALVAFALLAPALTSAVAVSAAAPRVIVIEGGDMAMPVVLDDWQDNHRFLLALQEVSGAPPPLQGRPFLYLRMFWGPQVDTYVTQGGDLTLLPEAQIGGRQDARLYLAKDTEPLILAYAGSLHELGPDARAVLEERAIPLHISVESGGQSVDRGWWVAAAIVSLALALAASLRLLGNR